MAAPPPTVPTTLVGLKTLGDLANAIGCSQGQLRYLAHNLPEKNKYKVRPVPKKSGGFRKIHIPRQDLKAVQRMLASALAATYRPNGRATAYIKGSSILRNALFHEKSRLVLNIDLENYFGQVTARRIYGMLRAKPYEMSNSVATAIVRLTCYMGSVPQGAPSSPVLANMLTSYLDGMLVNVCRKYGCSYSRYSDDITISTNRRKFPKNILRHDGEPLVDAFDHLGEDITEAFCKSGFKINASKVRLLHKHDRQEVTGLTINEFVNPSRKIFRQTRKMLHILCAYGEKLALDEYNELHPHRPLTSYTDSVRGRIEYLKYIRGRGDPVVFRFVSKFNEFAEKKIKYIAPSDWIRQITSPVICLENSIEMRQGTAFHIGGGVFVTNHHVLHYNGKFDGNMKMVVPGSHQRLPIWLIDSYPDREIAFFRCADPERSFLLPQDWLAVSNDLLVSLGSEVTLIGFPDWKEGDSHHVEKGAITAFTQKDGISALRLSTKVFFGNSGGPVINQQGEVVAVAFAGASVLEDDEFSYLGVPLSLLQQSLIDSGLL